MSWSGMDLQQKEIMVCLIINGDKLPPAVKKLLEKLTKIPGMTSILIISIKKKTNVIMGSKVCPLLGTDVYHRLYR